MLVLATTIEFVGRRDTGLGRSFTWGGHEQSIPRFHVRLRTPTGRVTSPGLRKSLTDQPTNSITSWSCSELKPECVPETDVRALASQAQHGDGPTACGPQSSKH